MVYDIWLFARESSQHTRDEWSAKRKLFSALPRDLYAGLACLLFPFHYNIEYQREFAT